MAALIQNETLLLVLIFGAVVMAVLGIGMAFQRNRGADRIGEAANMHETATVGDTKVYGGGMSRALRMIEPLQRRLTQEGASDAGQIHKRLIEAGYYRRSNVDTYFTARLVLAIAGGLISSLVVFFNPSLVRGSFILVFILGMTAVGYYLPVAFIHLRIRHRRNEFTTGMPDAIDMILVGVQAGLSLPAALQHVVEELDRAHPVVAEQFQLVSLEFQAGKSRAEALERLTKRMDVPEARSFATMVTQAEQMGTSVSDTLEVIASEMRTARMLRAEKEAAEIPVRMSVPLVMLIFPALFLIIVTPVAIKFLRTFSDMAAGG